MFPPPPPPAGGTQGGSGSSQSAGDRQRSGNFSAQGEAATGSPGNPATPTAQTNNDGCTFDANGNPTCVVQSEPAIDEPVSIDRSVRISDKITPLRLPQKECDMLINAYFGNYNSVVATIQDIKGNDYGDHLARNGALHIYGNSDATSQNTPLYLPLDSNGKSPEFQNSNAHEEKSNTTWTNVFRWKYKNGLVIEFFHVGGTTEGKKIPPRTTSKLGNYPNQTNSMGSVQIGYIGGLGSSDPKYRHSHLNFKVNGVRVDPRHFFCAGYSKELEPKKYDGKNR